jgi:hypothetical protein
VSKKPAAGRGTQYFVGPLQAVHSTRTAVAKCETVNFQETCGRAWLCTTENIKLRLENPSGIEEITILR